jgi:plastocyanin
MPITRSWLFAAAAAMAVACSDNSTSPNNGGTNGGTGGGTGGGTTAPTTANVTVGNIFFQSVRNGTRNAAVDTVAAGGTVTWTWVNTGSISHSVQSVGTPSFTSSGVLAGDGQTYTMMFSTAGTYQYDCAVHGTQMTGTIVVQ